jgi:hypothetical protein
LVSEVRIRLSPIYLTIGGFHSNLSRPAAAIYSYRIGVPISIDILVGERKRVNFMEQVDMCIANDNPLYYVDHHLPDISLVGL